MAWGNVRRGSRPLGWFAAWLVCVAAISATTLLTVPARASQNPLDAFESVALVQTPGAPGPDSLLRIQIFHRPLHLDYTVLVFSDGIEAEAVRRKGAETSEWVLSSRQPHGRALIGAMRRDLEQQGLAHLRVRLLTVGCDAPSASSFSIEDFNNPARSQFLKAGFCF